MKFVLKNNLKEKERLIMNKYILCIKSDFKNTGFSLWKKEVIIGKKAISFCIKNNWVLRDEIILWKPIWINNYNFNNYSDGDFYYNFLTVINDFLDGKHSKLSYALEDLPIFIENESFGKKIEYLNGNIFGFFYQIYDRESNGVNCKEWQNWIFKNYSSISHIKLLDNIKWNKEISIILAKYLIEKNNWNIDIKNNQNIADSLLIGWYVLNKKVGDK